MTHVTLFPGLPPSARQHRPFAAREKPLLDSVNCVTLRLRSAMDGVPAVRAGALPGGVTPGVDFARAKSK